MDAKQRQTEKLLKQIERKVIKTIEIAEQIRVKRAEEIIKAIDLFRGRGGANPPSA